MKIGFANFFGIILILISATSAKAYSWAMQAECHFISANQKKQINGTCQIEGSSGQGMEFFTITWKDGVKTKVIGNFVSESNYTVDDRPAVMKRVNNVTILQTQSGNVIIFFKLKNINP